MDIITEEVNRYFAPDVTVYKFVGTIHELQHIIRSPIPILFADNVLYFTVDLSQIPEDDSRISIFRAGS